MSSNIPGSILGRVDKIHPDHIIPWGGYAIGTVQNAIGNVPAAGGTTAIIERKAS